MKDKIVALEREIIEETIKTTDEQEQFRIRYLGSKNIIKELFLEIKSVPNEEKKEVGKLLNNLKQAQYLQGQPGQLIKGPAFQYSQSF